MSSVKKIALELKRLRGEQPVNQISKATGIPRSMLERYEDGERVPGDKNLELLALFYKVDFAELKMLVFEDRFPEHSRDRQILLAWLRRLECQL